MHAVQRALSKPGRIASLVKNVAIIDRRKLYQLWEHYHLTRLLAYLDVDCVFDIGANQGQYAEMLRRETGYEGFIFSFEPNPTDARIARKRSESDEKWMVIELAIAETDGEAQFNVMRSSQLSSLNTPKHDEVDLFRDMNSVVETVAVKTERAGNRAAPFAGQIRIRAAIPENGYARLRCEDRQSLGGCHAHLCRHTK